MKPDIVTPGIITIVGKSNSGKTTLIEKLIFRLTQNGYKIGSVKHAHGGFEMDKKGKDSWRHKHAGAAATLVVSTDKAALVKDDNSDELEKISAYLPDMDIILAEGFKSLDLPKIEIFRKESDHTTPLCMNDHRLIAFVTDTDYAPEVPIFGIDDSDAIADFIETAYLKPSAS